MVEMAKIQAINKVGMAQSARKAAIKDGQDMANLVIWAEIKYGKMLAAIEREYKFVGSRPGTDELGYKKPPKQKKTLPPGVTKKESHIAQTIAANVKTAKLVMAIAEKEDRLAGVG